MTNYSNSTTQMWLDFEALSPETIDLSPESIAQAVELSTNIPNQQQQWQTYLNVLALYAFEEWLGSRSIDLTIDREHCPVLQPAIANAIDAVCNLKVNEFNICLMAAGSLIDEEVTLPRAVVDIPEFVPHFYVLVEVQEEQETAVVHSFLSYEQLVNRRASVNLEADEDWTYQLPLTWFEADPDRLLLFLRCLEPMAMSLPSSQSDRTMQLSQIRSELEALLPQLESPERQLWEVLTWEQGTAVLTNPELLNWVYQLQRGEITSASSQISLQQHLSDILQLLTQPAVNVGRWLWNELDELAQEVSWVLLPSLAPAAAMRSPVEEFEAIVIQLGQAGVEIPTQARGAYRDLQLAGMPLRLYAVTWPVLSESIPEWTLLLVLGATPGTSLPPGLRLRVSDQTGVLVEQVLDTQASDSYFFTSVVGSWDEKFIVTVGLTPNIEQTLPPFSFNPER
ncbi:MAG TPA: DUF1822 family protein [Candidatus Sericytochromatia bacterium]